MTIELNEELSAVDVSHLYQKISDLLAKVGAIDPNTSKEPTVKDMELLFSKVLAEKDLSTKVKCLKECLHILEVTLINSKELNAMD